jgi:hypothetical protein
MTACLDPLQFGLPVQRGEECRLSCGAAAWAAPDARTWLGFEKMLRGRTSASQDNVFMFQTFGCWNEPSEGKIANGAGGQKKGGSRSSPLLSGYDWG